MEEKKIEFKSINKKRKQFRQKRRNSESEESETEVDREKLEETLEKQKLRQRSSGVSHITLASGKKVSKVEEALAQAAQDPFKLKTGGILDLEQAKRARRVMDQQDGSANDKNREQEILVGTQFSKGNLMI